MHSAETAGTGGCARRRGLRLAGSEHPDAGGLDGEGVAGPPLRTPFRERGGVGRPEGQHGRSCARDDRGYAVPAERSHQLEALRHRRSSLVLVEPVASGGQEVLRLTAEGGDQQRCSARVRSGVGVRHAPGQQATGDACSRGADVVPPAEVCPPDCAALIASTSWAFFIELAPEMPMPPAIFLRSARSIELRPPPRFFVAGPPSAGASAEDSAEDSEVCVT